MEKIKVAVLGYGHWGPFLVRNFSRLETCQVSLIVDWDKNRLAAARKLFPQVETSREIDDCFKVGVCDAVAISLPVSMHTKVAELALERGKHVFCEKPLSLKLSESKKLFQLAQLKKKILFVDYTPIYSSEIQYLKKLCIKLLPNIYTVDIKRLSFGIFRKDIDVVYDLASHDSAILSYLFGKPQKVKAIGRAHVNHRLVDDAHLFAFYPNKLIAQIHVSWLFPKKVRDITVVSDKRMVVFDDMKRTGKIEVVDQGVSLKRLPHPEYFSTYQELIYKYRIGKVSVPKMRTKEPLMMACEEFVSQIASKRTRDINLYLDTAGLTEAFAKSLKTGREVKLS